MMKRIVLVGVLMSAFLGNAASGERAILRADSPICESETLAEILNRQNLKHQPGSEIVARVNSTVEFERLHAKAQRGLKDMALREDQIRASYRMRGSSAAQANVSAQEEVKALSEAERFERFQQHCMATGTEQTAELLESRAISGLSKIRTAINGKDAEVWTLGYYLAPAGQ